jgi:Acyltransferase family
MADPSSAAALAAATPATRDRYVDLLRVVALGAVMLGHFLMAAVVVDAVGGVSVTNSLAVVPELRILTWLFQVMPVFFAVGGFSHAVALASLARANASYADFAVSRVERLLRPTMAFLWAGLAAGILVEATGHLDDRAAMVLRLVAQPLWFVGIYLAVLAFAPWMLRAHRRWGVRVVVVLAVLTALIDALRLGLDVPYVGFLNFATVWLAVHQCGFFYADGVPQRGGRAFALRLALLGLACTVALVWLLPYPLSMVSLPGEAVSNMTPPSLALMTYSAWLLGLVLLLRPVVTRWLADVRVWTGVVVANGVVMTAFLWHLTAIVIVTGSLALAGASVFPAIGGFAWWLLRVPFLVACALVLGGFVWLFRRFERVGPFAPVASKQRRPHRDGLAALGLAAALLGVLGFSVAGFAGVLSLRTATLVIVPMSSAVAALLVWGGRSLVTRAASAVSH